MIRLTSFCAALGMLATPAVAETSYACTLNMVCAGVWEGCDATDAPVRLDITPERIAVTAMGEIFTFDEVVRAFGTADEGFTATGVNLTTDAARYVTMVFQEDTLGVIVSEDQNGNGEYRGSHSFAADCGAD